MTRRAIRRNGRRVGVVGAASAAPWTPASLSGLEGWYRGDDTVDAGGVVATWTDKSGNARDLTQATALSRPAPVTRAGQRALNFGGTSWVRGAFGSLFAQPLTIYFVWEAQSFAGTYIAVDGDDGTNRVFLLTTTTPAIRGGATSQIGTNTPSTGQIYATAFIANGVSSSLFGLSNFVTADATGNAGAMGLDGLTVGASSAAGFMWPGYSWELIVYSGAHNAATRKLIGDYFTARYAGLSVIT